MANLFDYLEWRGDVPFLVDPFNEVDNLILAELAYTDFSQILADGGEASIADVCDVFFHTHDRAELEKASSHIERAALLMEGMSVGARFGNTRLCCFIDEIDEAKGAQVSAVTYLLDDGTAYVAFRGTDSTLVGWKEDFALSFLSETEGQRRAVKYLNDVACILDCPLRVGGHSKGGNFAVYASAFCDQEVQDRIIQVYTNDGPGFRESVLGEEGYNRILSRIVSLIPDTSIVGMMLSTKSEQQVVESSANGFGQHDGFTWQLQRNRFVRTNLSELGGYIEETLGNWLEQMDDATRRSLADTLFGLFESTGLDTFDEIGERKLKSIETMLTSVIGLPKEKRQLLLKLAGRLIQSTGQTAVSSIQELGFGKD